MKKLLCIAALFLSGCSPVSLVENWKNPDIVIFNAQKVLIVGMAPDEKAREKFESKLSKEFEKRNIESMRSLDVFDVAFTNSPRTEKELDDFEQTLLNKDFDAILFTKIVGSEDKESFIKTLNSLDYHQGRFNDDYMKHQGIYYEDNYYDKFTIYHAETTLYCICEGKERSIIWRGSIDITDPKDIEKTIDDYIKLVVIALEDQDLIFRKKSTDEITGL